MPGESWQRCSWTQPEPRWQPCLVQIQASIPFWTNFLCHCACFLHSSLDVAPSTASSMACRQQQRAARCALCKIALLAGRTACAFHGAEGCNVLALAAALLSTAEPALSGWQHCPSFAGEIVFTSCGTESDSWAIWGAVTGPAGRAVRIRSGQLPHIVSRQGALLCRFVDTIWGSFFCHSKGLGSVKPWHLRSTSMICKAAALKRRAAALR